MIMFTGNGIVFLPDPKNYYCRDCDEYFDELSHPIDSNGFRATWKACPLCGGEDYNELIEEIKAELKNKDDFNVYKAYCKHYKLSSNVPANLKKFIEWRANL